MNKSEKFDLLGICKYVLEAVVHDHIFTFSVTSQLEINTPSMIHMECMSIFLNVSIQLRGTLVPYKERYQRKTWKIYLVPVIYVCLTEMSY